MKGHLVAAAVFALLGYPAQAAARPNPEAGRMKLVERVGQAQANYSAKDYAGVLEKLDAAMAQPEFAVLSDEKRAQIYGMAALSAQAVGMREVAYGHALAGTKLKGAPPYLWQMRLGSEVNNQNFADAVATVQAVAVQSPDTLDDWPMIWLIRLNRAAAKLPDKSVQRRLLIVLTGPAYQPREPLAETEGFKRDLALLRLADGDVAGARALMAGVDSPSILIRASVDPRLAPMLPAGVDIRASVERRLARLREVAASHPGSMAAVLEVARCLRMLGRAEESLATVESVRPDGPQAASFSDLDEERNWWWNSLGQSHVMLGHYDAAVAAFRKGAEAGEYGGPNVSQALNLADVQLRFGHPNDALATLAPFDRPEPTPVQKSAGVGGTIDGATARRKMSPYGEMVYRSIHGAALIALGQPEAARPDIAYAAAHEKDHPNALLDLQVRSGDKDAAAATLIRRLDDPDRRGDAILELSNFDDPPVAMPPDPFETGLKALMQRPDVKAAMARAGGIRTFHIQADFP